LPTPGAPVEDEDDDEFEDEFKWNDLAISN
jgi:hypothetical protein